MTKNKENEITFFVFADEFCYAAMQLENANNKNKVSIPSYYLYAHAIELSYKSYLFKNGVELEYLKRIIGHNLEKGLKKSRELGLDKKLTDDPGYISIVKAINKYYVTKEFEYMSAVAKTFPVLADVKRVTKETMSATFDCINGYI